MRERCSPSLHGYQAPVQVVEPPQHSHPHSPGRPLQGRLSRRVQQVPPSGIRRFFDIAATLEDVISLGIGEPDFTTPPPILQAGLNSLERGQTGYTANAGMMALREAIAAMLHRRYQGPRYDPATEVLVTVGVSEGMYLAMQALLDPGDEVLVPQPCFVSYPADVVLAGGTVVEIPTCARHRFVPTPEQLEAAITPRTKALLIGYPCNPTGAVMDREELLAIARVVARHDLLVISDEIYDRLVYDGHQHVMFASLPGMAQRTIHLGGMSKDYAMTGWRVGYAAGPAELIGAMRKIHQYLIMSAPTPSQIAALAALTDPAAEEAVQAMVAAYDARRRLMVAGLNQMGLTCVVPRGAFYAFPSVASTGMDEYTFAERLLVEEKVAVIPGSVFGKGGEGHVRCAYAASEAHIQEALERMARFIQRHRMA